MFVMVAILASTLVEAMDHEKPKKGFKRLFSSKDKKGKGKARSPLDIDDFEELLPGGEDYEEAETEKGKGKEKEEKKHLDIGEFRELVGF